MEQKFQKKSQQRVCDHRAFGPPVKQPQSETGVHLVEHPGGRRLSPLAWLGTVQVAGG